MSNRTQRATGVRLLLSIALGVAALAPFAAAQDAPEEPAGPPAVAIDVEQLLGSPEVVREFFRDDVFHLGAGEERQLIMVPLTPLSVAEDTEVTQFSVKLAAGRFLAFYLPPVEGKSIEPKMNETFTGANEVTVTLDVSPPRLAKECILTADGKIKWSMPRVLLNGSFREPRNAYVLKGDRTQLLPPEQPRIVRGNSESPAQFTQRRKEELAAYYARRSAYMVTRKVVADLPDDFEEPAPPTIWAIYETSKLLRDFKLDGQPPLPWKLDIDQFTELRSMTMSWPAKLGPLHETVTELLADGNPLSLRAAAVAVSAGETPRGIPADHPLVDQILTLLSKGDRKTRMLIAGGFARNAAEAPAAGRVLLAAAADPDPAVTFGALAARVAVAGSTPDPALTAKVTESVTRLLPMAEAPPIDDLLGVAQSLSSKQPETLAALAKDIDLSRVHADRRDAMIYRVLTLAASNGPLAEQWLDQQLLGSADARLRNQTLAKIIELSAPPAPPAEGEAPAAGAAPATPTYRLVSPDHAIVKLVASDDGDLRKTAWKAIQAFRIVTPAAANPAESAEAAEPSPVYAAVTNAAFKHQPTPTPALTFLIAQPDAPAASDQITRLAIDGDGPIRVGAIRQLASAGRDPFAARFTALTPEQRIDLARVWYGADPRPEPAITVESIEPVLGLLTLTAAFDPTAEGAAPPEGDAAETPAKIVGWFGGAMAVGERPDPRAWVSAAGGEQPLLRVLAMGEPAQRRAAAAALSSLAAWPNEADIAAAIKIADDIARTEPDVNLRVPKLSGDWAAAKIKLAGQTLTDSGGTFVVQLVAPAPRPEGAGPLDPTPEPTVTEIGRIAIGVSPTPDKPDSYTAVVDPESVAIEAITDPASLKIVDGLTLNQLAGDKLDTNSALAADPISLAPTAGGGWAGTTKRALGGPIGVELIPAK